MFVLYAKSCTTQDNLVLKTLRRHVSLDTVHTSSDLVRERRQQDLSIIDSRISIKSKNNGLISEFEVRTLYNFIKEANRVMERAPKREEVYSANI